MRTASEVILRNKANQQIIDKRYPGCYAELDNLDMWTIYTAEGNDIMSDRELEFAWACARWYVEHEHDWRRIETGNVEFRRRRDQIARYVIGSGGLMVLAGLIVWLVKGL